MLEFGIQLENAFKSINVSTGKKSNKPRVCSLRDNVIKRSTKIFFRFVRSFNLNS